MVNKFNKLRALFFNLRSIVFAYYEICREILFLIYFKIRPVKINPKGIQEILHINTEDGPGGAARIANDLMTSQRMKGFSSFLLVDRKFTKSDAVLTFRPARNKRLHAYREQANKSLQWLDVLCFQDSIFENELIKQPSIIHLHNTHGSYFSPFLLPKLSRKSPLIWTLHDMFAFTGHCAHAFSCERWKIGCGSCPLLDTYPKLNKDTTQFLWQIKNMIYHSCNIHIVVVSKWMQNLVNQSMLKQMPTTLIYNGINTDVFYPKNKSALRKKYNISADKKVLLFVANLGTQNPYKGGEFLKKLIADLEFSSCIFIAVGGTKSFEQDNVIYVPFIEESYVMSDYYSLADLYIYPSLADNCPLVVLESMACGTPVISFETGGIPELVIHQETGYIAKYGDYSDLKNGLEWLLADGDRRRELGNKGCERVNDFFTLEKMEANYLDLYRSILKGESQNTHS